LRDTSDRLDALGPVRGAPLPHILESLGALLYVGGVDQLLANQHMQKPVREGCIRSGPQAEMQGRPLSGGRTPGVGDDQAPAVPLLLLEVPHDWRHCFGEIAANEQDRLGEGNVLQRKRQAAIQTERPSRPGGRRGHAESSVVIDVRRAERHARELAE
jgi:hypothetical protein